MDIGRMLLLTQHMGLIVVGLLDDGLLLGNNAYL
jgi:hypothetical protein